MIKLDLMAKKLKSSYTKEVNLLKLMDIGKICKTGLHVLLLVEEELQPYTENVSLPSILK